MAAWWRWWVRCRLQAPSKISSRNRNLVYVIVLFPMLMVLLLIPGGEIANYKYSGDESKDDFVTVFDRPQPPTSFEDDQADDDDDAQQTRSVRNKLVLLWTGYFESRAWRVTGDAFKDCPVSTCELSLDRRKAPEADAILFNSRDITPSSLFPEHPPDQVWILHNSEPPYNIYIDLRRYGNMFNWTSWYRTDADIFAPYGDYVEKSNSAGDNGSAAEALSDLDLNVFRLHDRVLFFAASNCCDRGRRYKRVAQLKNYLPLDEFGDCGRHHCPKGVEQCQQIFARYQFVLAFENGYCRDYVTEKLWNAYRRLQIPIVSGGADYKKFAIPGSYIDYDNFSTAEELSEFVHRVSTTAELYNSYFAWRRQFQVVRSPVTNWCRICEKLHDQGRQPQVYTDLAGWVAKDSCPLYSVYQHFWEQVYLGMFRLLGI